MSPTATTIPPWSSSISALAPTSVATAGKPRAMASAKASENPSVCDGNKNKSAASRSEITVLCSWTPASTILSGCFSGAISSLTSPANTKVISGKYFATSKISAAPLLTDPLPVNITFRICSRITLDGAIKSSSTKFGIFVLSTPYTSRRYCLLLSHNTYSILHIFRILFRKCLVI